MRIFSFSLALVILMGTSSQGFAAANCDAHKCGGKKLLGPYTLKKGDNCPGLLQQSGRFNFTSKKQIEDINTAAVVGSQFACASAQPGQQLCYPSVQVNKC
jgi:hypothetical protein